MTFLAKYLVQIGIVVALGLATLFGVRSCRDGNQTEAAAVMKERIRLDSLKLVGDSVALADTRTQLNMALANGVKVVDRWHTSAPLPVNTGTPHDSITQLTAQVRTCRTLGDSLVKSVVMIQSSCAAFRDTATRSIANLKTANAHLDSLYKIGKPPKRWSIGPFIGYGIRQDSVWAIKRGWTAGVGVSYHIIQW